VGAGIAAEIGSMMVTEQVDALRMCAADPIDYLVAPRFIASVIMTMILVIWAGFVAFVDPPFSAAALDAVLAAAGERACVHALWGENEVHFAGKVAAAEYDLDVALRRVYRVLSRADGRPFDGDLERELAANGRLLAKLPTLAAAVATLREAGLLASEGGKNRVRKVDGKVDLTTSPTYRRWHRPHTSQFLQRCLTARI